jgi:3-phenylpropionate/trans-cinnamate dioxygenase ferredoxin reductase subunit
VVIVGSGQAGFQAAVSLRENGHLGPISLVGDEHQLPYQRPPLSKKYLDGSQDADAVWLRPESFYKAHAVRLHRGDAVVAIDRSGRRAHLKSGRSLDYAHLVLALGARPSWPRLPGIDADNVHCLRTFDEADALRTRLTEHSRVVVIGAGFIGMEIAAMAASQGHRVTVIDVADRVMSRGVAPELSAHVTAVHESRGNTVLLSQVVAALHGGNGVEAVELGDGQLIPADVVVVGVGVRPNTEVAEAAGLAIDNGIVVDDQLLTSDPRISAIGDCANYPSVHAGGRVRLESVQNAVDQARHVARRLSGQATCAYSEVPWFWTNQFDMRIQTAGIGGADDERLVRGDRANGKFSVFRFREGTLVAVESVGRPADHMAARKLLAQEWRPTPEQVAAEDFDLKKFATVAVPAHTR